MCQLRRLDSGSELVIDLDLTVSHPIANIVNSLSFVFVPMQTPTSFLKQ